MQEIIKWIKKHPLLFVMFLILGILVIWLGINNSPSKQIENIKGTPLEACKASQDLIKRGVKPSFGEILKSPASAQFYDCSQYNINFVGLDKELKQDKNSDIGVFMVSGSIDSQNGFGALIRNYYCAAMFKGIDGWQIWQLNFQEEPYLNCFFDTP